jgi:hypothetical protein
MDVPALHPRDPAGVEIHLRYDGERRRGHGGDRKLSE